MTIYVAFKPVIPTIRDAHQLNFVVKSLIVIDKNKQISSSQTGKQAKYI